jgi:hypothetical protein
VIRTLKNRIKYTAILIVIISVLFLYLQDCLAGTASIKNVTKTYKMGGYVILINYETQDKWTDGLIFKAHCKFENGEFTFTSGSLNNVERGWHKTQIAISDIIKKRHGSLVSYEIELYKNGVLVDKKE